MSRPTLLIFVTLTTVVLALDIDQLHKDKFKEVRSKESPYIYGRVLPGHMEDENNGNKEDKKPFNVENMFSSAMGNKLKRLVTEVDQKMIKKSSHGTEDSNLGNKKKKEDTLPNKRTNDEETPHIFSRHRNVMNFNNIDKRGQAGNHIFRRYAKSSFRQQKASMDPMNMFPTSKRFSENEKRLDLSELDGSYHEGRRQEMSPLWMGGQGSQVHTRIPPDLRKRKYDDEENNVWYSNSKDVSVESETEKKRMSTKSSDEKKDTEKTDYTFFKDNNDVMKELKRIFPDDKNVKDSNDYHIKEQEDRAAKEQENQLMDEYIKHMAQVMSINKKRSAMSWQQQEELYEIEQVNRMDHKLKKIENLILDEVDDIIKNEQDDPETESMVMNRVNAARDLEAIRQSLSDLERTMINIREEEGIEDDVKRMEAVKRGNRLANALGITAPADRRKRTRDGDSNDDIVTEKQEEKLYDSSEECPDEEFYSKDCTLLSNFLPDGEYMEYFKSACSSHQLCYVCMDVLGMTAAECDSGFLKEASTICEGNKPCRTASKTMVLNNRRKRASRTNSNPDSCTVQVCLRNSKDRRRR